METQIGAYADMVEAALTDEEVSELERRLLAATPPQGPIGNGAGELYAYNRVQLISGG